jgi:hypothetical protein
MRATLESHTHESHAYKRYSYKNPFCYSIPPYRWKDLTKPKPAHPLSYRLWWVMLAKRSFSRFSEFMFWVFLSLYPTICGPKRARSWQNSFNNSMMIRRISHLLLCLSAKSERLTFAQKIQLVILNANITQASGVIGILHVTYVIHKLCKAATRDVETEGPAAFIKPLSLWCVRLCGCLAKFSTR